MSARRRPNADLAHEHLTRAASALDREGFRQKADNKPLADQLWRLCDATKALAKQIDELTRDHRELR